MPAQRLNPEQLRRVFNSARNEPELTAALQRVQDSVLALNGLLPEAEKVALRDRIKGNRE